MNSHDFSNVGVAVMGRFATIRRLRVAIGYTGIMFAAILLIAWCSTVQFAKAETDDRQKIDLVEKSPNAQVQVALGVEIRGALILDEADTARTVPMDVEAEYRYAERTVQKSEVRKAIRYYEVARSEVELGEAKTTKQLGQDNRYLILEHRPIPVTDKRVRFQSPQATLTAGELSLIDTPANSMLLNQWLSKRDVAVQELWFSDSQLLADVLTWDEVSVNEVQFKLIELRGDEARIFVSGSAEGSIDGADAEATLKGTARFNRRQGRVTHLRLKINENRDPSQVAPGFEATVWIDQSIEPAKAMRLTNAELGKMKMSPMSRPDQLHLDAKCGPYSLTHKRHWRLISNRRERAVLRCIQDGVVLGQCDIIPLRKQPEGVAPTLAQFKTNVEKALANKNARIVGSRQSPAIDRQSWMRVDAAGTSQKIPMRWIYYTVTSPNRQRVQLLFTVEEAVYDEFSGYEKELIDGIQFDPSGESAEADADPSTGQETARLESSSN